MVYDYSRNEPTLVMATKGTIESEKFNMLYHKYDNHKTELLECVGLADEIEKGDQEEINNYLRNQLKKYKGKIKNVVLRLYSLSFNSRANKRSFRKRYYIFQWRSQFGKTFERSIRRRTVTW